jgi:hypothetical protein
MIFHRRSGKYLAGHAFRIHEPGKPVLKCRLYVVPVVNAQTKFMSENGEKEWKLNSQQ